MPRTPARQRVRARVLQPVLNYVARKHARAREIARAMEMPCTACRQPLSSHIGAGNRWKGCA